MFHIAVKILFSPLVQDPEKSFDLPFGLRMEHIMGLSFQKILQRIMIRIIFPVVDLGGSDPVHQHLRHITPWHLHALNRVSRLVDTVIEPVVEMMLVSALVVEPGVRAIREMLDANGHYTAPIMSYAVKYASGFYGPFRDAAGSAPSFGDRKSYQMDFHNSREGIKEALMDVEEGADIIMVKPAMAYQDMITRVREEVNVPVAAYSVSGEYAMVKAGASLGYIEEERIISEMAVGVYRAGADIYLTYFAPEIARLMDEGRIG